MKIYTYEPAQHRSPNARSSRSDLPPLSPGTSWVRFGQETLLYGDDDASGEAGTVAPSSRGARMPSRQVNATREQLHVVVQHGRLFQQHHPEVPVLHDRGRFLLVQARSGTRPAAAGGGGNLLRGNAPGRRPGRVRGAGQGGRAGAGAVHPGSRQQPDPRVLGSQPHEVGLVRDAAIRRAPVTPRPSRLSRTSSTRWATSRVSRSCRLAPALPGM